tara:strand:- start:2814 stop:3122 length:309 start_codon:yes stop_codon:yes gene_type:complete
MAVRDFDTLTTGHGCAATTTLSFSLVRTVKANGIAGAVVGTPTVSHNAPICPPPNICCPHIMFLNAGSPNVKISGIPWGRVGDSADAGAMILGSTNVFANGK